MEEIQKLKQKPRGRILSIFIVAALLIAAASAFIIYRSITTAWLVQASVL